MGARPRATSIAVLASLPACGLVSYEPEPIDVAALVQRVEADRDAATAGVRRATNSPSSPALAKMISTRWRRDPEVRARRAAVRVAAALVDVPTPLADPRLSLGANVAIGSSVTDDELAFPAVQASVPIPLFSDRRARRNARNAARLDVARAELRRAMRLAALDTRVLWAEAAMAEERARATETVAALARELARSAESLVAAGGATALDVALLRLEATAAERDVFDANIRADAARAALANALVVPPDTFEGRSFLGADASSSSSAWLEGLSIPSISWEESARAHRTDLALLDVRYAAAEAELALAIARQVQDVNINASYAPEPAEAFRIVGLALAGALPIFARNAQNIATALADRTRARVLFGAALDRLAIDVASARAAVERAERQSEYVRDRLVPAVEAVREAASLTVEIGGASALSLLAATRSRVDVTLDVVVARQALVRAWLDLERAVEAPVLALPGTDVESIVAWPPDEPLRQPDWEGEMWNDESISGAPE